MKITWDSRTNPRRCFNALPCDPMGPVLYTASPAKERIRAEASHLYPPEGPGLRVELDPDKLNALTVASA